MINFHLLEVVGRGSETQLQVGENFNYWIQPFKLIVWHKYMYRGFNIMNGQPNNIWMLDVPIFNSLKLNIPK